MKVVVLGGSGSVGLEITKALLSCDECQVSSSYCKNPDPLQGLVEQNRDLLRAFRIDLEDFASIEAVMRGEINHLGGLDVIVNAAGAAGKPDFLIRADVERIESVISVNLTGPILATKFAVPFLLEKQKSAVLNISSVSAVVPTGGVT